MSLLVQAAERSSKLMSLFVQAAARARAAFLSDVAEGRVERVRRVLQRPAKEGESIIDSADEVYGEDKQGSGP